MVAKLPIISSPVNSGLLLRAIKFMRAGRTRETFCGTLKLFTGSKYVYPMNSGIASFYVLLTALSRISAGREVILPAYTAGSLVVAVRKAGLKPVLCDISLRDFNMDIGSLAGAVSDSTLAVICVHSFGIIVRGIDKLREAMPSSVFLVEDCAQSMGSVTEKPQPRPAETIPQAGAGGGFGDASFFSFNRGKNIPLSGGGFISTNDERIAARIKTEAETLGEEGFIRKFYAPLEVLAFSIVSNPAIYAQVFPLAARFKETAPPEDFTVKKMGDFQAGLGLALFEERERIFSKRYANGMALIDGLNNIDGIVIPEIPDRSRYVFNRLPVLFKDPALRDMAAVRLWEEGVETSPMYISPLHHMFDLGYGRDEFPNAVYCAPRLLTLPTHPLVDESAIARIVKAIKETV